jgi:proton-coupled amino acid transporter
VSLFKGFVVTSVLYLPKAFVNGGWALTIVMLFISANITVYCGLLLLEVRAKLGTSNYSMLGELVFGKIGMIAVDMSLWSSLVGFCCAYLFFIKENLHQVLL